MNPATYTESELETLRQAVIISGHAVVFCEFTIVSMGIEIAALGQQIVGATQTYPDNDLIQLLFAKYADGKAEEQASDAEEITPAKLLETALDLIEKALGILERKASPEDIQIYKAFLYSCAEHTANAAGEGLFGTGSEKVSQKEAAILSELKVALGL